MTYSLFLSTTLASIEDSIASCSVRISALGKVPPFVSQREREATRVFEDQRLAEANAFLCSLLRIRRVLSVKLAQAKCKEARREARNADELYWGHKDDFERHGDEASKFHTEQADKERKELWAKADLLLREYLAMKRKVP